MHKTEVPDIKMVQPEFQQKLSTTGAHRPVAIVGRVTAYTLVPCFSESTFISSQR